MKLYTEDDNRVRDPIQIKEDYSHTLAQELAPNIAEKASVALSVDVYNFYFFQRIKVGRRCSCSTVETSPDGKCEVCWGTGAVGGYEKHGFKTEVVDVTFPNLVTVNVLPDYVNQLRPTPFTLTPGATRGYVEAKIPILHNLGILDYMELVTYRPPATSVSAYIRTWAESDFVLMTREAVQARLSSKELIVRFTLSRQNPDAELPRVSHFRLRYKMKADPRIRADIPKRSESIILAEMGITDNYSPITMVLDRTLKMIDVSDFFVLLDENSRTTYRFKVTEVTPFKPYEYLIGWELTARYAYSHENYSIFPVESFFRIASDDLVPPLTLPRIKPVNEPMGVVFLP